MERKEEIRKYIKLFASMLYISAFTFGGGFVIITFMKKKFVDELRWIDEQEMLDLAALAQSSPGAIAVNAAILVGWKIGKVFGVFIAVLGTIIPPVVIITVVSFVYEMFATNVYVVMILKGMQIGVAAIIIDAVLSLGKTVLKTKSVLYMVIMISAFIATFFFDVNVVYIILMVGMIGVLTTLVKRREPEQK